MGTASTAVIGLLNPGDMGAAVGRCLTGRGLTVLWASEGRSADTAARAESAGLTDAGTPRKVAAGADVIISVCPPHAALDVAWTVHGFTGLYLDANAVAPDTAREVASLIEGNGGQYVDGGIIGPPPHQAGSTRLYLSGSSAGAIAALFDETALEARMAGPSPMAASALKMAYAGWTKGTSALLLGVRALAAAEGVEDALLGEWAQSLPHLRDHSDRAALAAVTKGWRWVGEMEEIAHAMTSAGLPDGFHQAAAEVYRRCPRLAGAEPGDKLTGTVLDAVTGA